MILRKIVGEIMVDSIRRKRDKHVYSFGQGSAEGDGSMRNELGGKGASLMVMNRLGLPVPPGFTIDTETCNLFFENDNKIPDTIREEILEALEVVGEMVGRKYGDPENPLLVSTRSGARMSMPGMMDTVLNIGLTSSTLPGIIALTNNERFAYDSYRRLIMMYSDVVMEKAEGIEPEEGRAIREQLEDILVDTKKQKGYKSDTELTVDDLKELCKKFKDRVKKVLGREFPDDPMEQLWNGIGGVFKSWWGKRAVSYRRIEGIPDEWGTGCTVQTMVFGNMGETSATGVAFTRNPATGDNIYYGECLFNAQGEDVVAGIRTPNPMNEASKTEQNKHLPTLESEMSEVYEQLCEIRKILELHSRDMLDIEFTIQEGTLYMVQSRVGKRTATAALNIALSMLDDGIIDPPTAVMRLTPEQISQLLYPIVDPEAEKNHTSLARGLPAGPGGAVGEIVFTSQKAVDETRKGKRVILVREETSPEDIEGMRAAIGILTARGGMTSHAAIVTRGWGKCCIVGAEALELDTDTMVLRIGDRTFLEGEVFTLNGTEGVVYEGQLPMVDSTKNPGLQRFLELADEFRFLGVRANADTPEDAQVALDFGAEGIGLYRTEHMFYGAESDEPLFILRKMILSKTEDERRRVLDELAPHVKENVKSTMEIMNGLPITFRLLDPPLHEFVPQSKIGQQKLAMALGIEPYEVRSRVMSLDESNPMMGHRGARLHLTYPEISEMQVRAIFQAVVELIQEGKEAKIELMMPVIIGYQELKAMKKIIEDVYDKVRQETGIDFEYLFGTMMETPRACLRASDMAQDAEFFSFGTNDLTQMGFGFSRDDIEVFLPHYLEKGLLQNDPFLSIDKRGIGELMKVAIERGRAKRPNLKLGVCGEHGGNARSVEFFHQIGLDYVSCSPYRIPIARLAAAQAALRDKIHRRRAASF